MRILLGPGQILVATVSAALWLVVSAEGANFVVTTTGIAVVEVYALN
jgi:hypothetical protein